MKECVLKHVRGGGSQVEAAHLFGINRKTLYRWLCSENSPAPPVRTRQGKLDKAKLEAHVREHSDMILRERAAVFGVTPSGMWRAMRQLGMRKKNDALCGEKSRRTHILSA